MSKKQIRLLKIVFYSCLALIMLAGIYLVFFATRIP